MQNLKLEKVTLNCGTGTDPTKLEKAYKLLNMITGKKPVRIRTLKRIPAFGIRPGLQIGCKVTVRKNAMQLLKILLDAIGNRLKENQICPGYFAFGIKEYIEVPGMSYNRDIGIMGFEVCATLKRAGKRIEKRKIKKSRIPKRHRITKEETIEFLKQNFNTEII
ncbi:MAG: 50S ribosomal protein L5 [Candidatus Pacearchaeota archaeon]